MIPVIVYAILFVLVDAIYLTNIAGPYGKMISNIQGKKMEMKILPAAVVYLSLIGAWYVFIFKERKGRSYLENIGRAALLGFFIYSVYDFTNLAIIDKYQLDLSLIDSVWGGVLYAITTAILFYFF
jgi:uncharacterized membrane protein